VHDTGLTEHHHDGIVTHGFSLSLLLSVSLSLSVFSLFAPLVLRSPLHSFLWLPSFFFLLT
jgi:hypothetical protein